MAVYVDNAFIRYGRMIMCHMLADSADEMHEMARRIGVQRHWYQGDHYDICKERRALAVNLGAQEITKREAVLVRRRFRDLVED